MKISYKYWFLAHCLGQDVNAATQIPVTDS